MATTQQQLTAQQLALYLGRKVSTDIGIGRIDTISLHNTVLVTFEGCDEDEACDFPCDEVKPILRKKDSLSDEEIDTLTKICDSIPPTRINHRYVGLSLFVGNPFAMTYLLSIGIDLFGWIDAGLAIDKATLENASN